MAEVAWLLVQSTSASKFIIEHEENQTTKSIEVDAITGMLYQNTVVRQSLTKAIKSLEIDGFYRLVVEKNGI